MTAPQASSRVRRRACESLFCPSDTCTFPTVQRLVLSRGVVTCACSPRAGLVAEMRKVVAAVEADRGRHPSPRLNRTRRDREDHHVRHHPPASQPCVHKPETGHTENRRSEPVPHICFPHHLVSRDDEHSLLGLGGEERRTPIAGPAAGQDPDARSVERCSSGRTDDGGGDSRPEGGGGRRVREHPRDTCSAAAGLRTSSGSRTFTAEPARRSDSHRISSTMTATPSTLMMIPDAAVTTVAARGREIRTAPAPSDTAR